MILEAKNISKTFFSQRGWLKKAFVGTRALDNINFRHQGDKTLGVVGESGCGKTTLAKIILRLISPSSGKIIVNREIIKNFRKDVQIIFQNPYNSLNPKMKILDIIKEPLFIHRIVKQDAFNSRAKELLEMTGLEEGALYRYPFEFSGGQRQRICIARALACEPKLIILDEPVSSLDLTIQLDILNLFLRLKRDLGLSYIFISHNLAVVRYIAEEVLVMKNGRIIEQGDCRQIFSKPLQPYTRSLVDASRA
jgi:peptide/nickel transport system ATP-binding protein